MAAMGSNPRVFPTGLRPAARSDRDTERPGHRALHSPPLPGLPMSLCTAGVVFVLTECMLGNSLSDRLPLETPRSQRGIHHEADTQGRSHKYSSVSVFMFCISHNLLNTYLNIRICLYLQLYMTFA